MEDFKGFSTPYGSIDPPPDEVPTHLTDDEFSLLHEKWQIIKESMEKAQVAHRLDDEGVTKGVAVSADALFAALDYSLILVGAYERWMGVKR